MASLVPEPIEKCAVCAASPSRTTLPCRQVWQRTVVKEVHRELLATRPWPAEHVRAQAADELDRGLVALPRREARGRRVAEPSPPPDVLVHLHDEGAGLLAVGVAVHLHDPRRGVQDVELERVEDQVRAEPDVPAPPALQVRAERSCEPAPRSRVHPVGGDHQVVARGQRGHVRGLGAEVHPHPERRAAGLQDSQQALAAHRGETVPARGKGGPAEVHVDVVPAGELAPHRRRRSPGPRARCRRGSRRRTPPRSRTCRRRRCAPRR